ncbi:hypothetical protein Nmel_014665 [Mimus melanotis]
MAVEKQGYLMAMTLPEMLVFNQLSGGISGCLLPKRIPRAASFHSCLLQSQALLAAAIHRRIKSNKNQIEKESTLRQQQKINLT